MGQSCKKTWRPSSAVERTMIMTGKDKGTLGSSCSTYLKVYGLVMSKTKMTPCVPKMGMGKDRAVRESRPFLADDMHSVKC